MNDIFAFPSDQRTGPAEPPCITGGLTKREYLATKFTAAIISSPYGIGVNKEDMQWAAEKGLALADALIEELKK